MGHVTEPVRTYDLMNVTMICLGNRGKHYGGPLRMLEVLFTDVCRQRGHTDFRRRVRVCLRTYHGKDGV